MGPDKQDHSRRDQTSSRQLYTTANKAKGDQTRPGCVMQTQAPSGTPPCSRSGETCRSTYYVLHAWCTNLTPGHHAQLSRCTAETLLAATSLNRLPTSSHARNPCGIASQHVRNAPAGMCEASKWQQLNCSSMPTTAAVAASAQAACKHSTGDAKQCTFTLPSPHPEDKNSCDFFKTVKSRNQEHTMDSWLGLLCRARR
jgi:hypothetical protein